MRVSICDPISINVSLEVEAFGFAEHEKEKKTSRITVKKVYNRVQRGQMKGEERKT